jgi:SAM-dependent methyltransferase
LALARRRGLSATFICADLAELTFAPESFDGVVALYVLFHLPRAEVRPLIGRVSDWLRPGGVFLVATMLGRGIGEAVEEWLGVPMFFSNSDPDADRELVREARLTIVEDGDHRPDRGRGRSTVPLDAGSEAEGRNAAAANHPVLERAAIANGGAITTTWFAQCLVPPMTDTARTADARRCVPGIVSR